MDKTKIEWADATWNPVTGCLHGCEYCYARRIAERFGLAYAPKLGDPGMEGARKCDSAEGLDTMLELVKPYETNGKTQPYPMAFLPTLHRYRLDRPAIWSKPRNIFVCSMADLFGDWVPSRWIKDVLEACEHAPQHRYLFLTKNPKRYIELDYMAMLPHSGKFWFGASVTNNAVDNSWLESARRSGLHTFWSVEPILEQIDFYKMRYSPDWIIVGAETGQRAGRVVPKKEWIDSIVSECIVRKIPLFMKDSLIPIVGEENMRRDFPWSHKEEA